MEMKNSEHNNGNIVFAKRADELMPSTFEAIKILQYRANQISKDQAVKQEITNKIDYIRFYLGDKQLYGIPFLTVKEVIHCSEINTLPYVPDWVAGIINHRGLLISIVDLKKYFKIQDKSSSDTSSEVIIVVQAASLTIGILISNIAGSDSYETSSLNESIASNHTIKSDYVLGLHHGQVGILDLDILFADIELQLKSATS